jgi:hypothetical protein
MNKQEKVIFTFLKKCDIIFNDLDTLKGTLIPRDILLSTKKYNEIQENIKELKKVFSSSSLTCLQKDANKKQKWPLLNLVRQILKTNDYKMTPKRKSNGYDEDGKKKYLRFFYIDKISTEEIKDISASIVE